MKHRTVGHRAAQVGAETAVRPLGVAQGEQTALVVKPGLVIVAEGVAFAGDQKVVFTAQAHLYRSTSFEGCQGRPDRQMP